MRVLAAMILPLFLYGLLIIALFGEPLPPVVLTNLWITELWMICYGLLVLWAGMTVAEEWT